MSRTPYMPAGAGQASRCVTIMVDGSPVSVRLKPGATLTAADVEALAELTRGMRSAAFRRRSAAWFRRKAAA